MSEKIGLRLVRGAVVSAGLLLLLQCGGPEPTCGLRNCAGCCDGNVCRAGTDMAACGEGGGACSTCIGGQDCSAGKCEASATTCGPGNCSGCCDGNVCKGGNAGDACGTAGGACATCTTGTSCEAGECKTVGALCSSNCSGCCSGNTCNPGNTAIACGRNGAACATCNTGFICDTAGSCAPDCATTCAGCCVGNTCRTGNANDACGKDAAACATCLQGFECSADRACVPEGGDVGADCTSQACKQGLVCLNDVEKQEHKCRNQCGSAGGCTASESCIAVTSGGGACVPKPPSSSTWNLFVGRVKVTQLNAGQYWDGGGGAPDLKVCFTVPNKPVVCTPEASDQFEHDFQWTSTTTYLYSDLASVQIHVWDIDVITDDLADRADNVNLQPLWADHTSCWNIDGVYNELLELRVCALP